MSPKLYCVSQPLGLRNWEPEEACRLSLKSEEFVPSGNNIFFAETDYCSAIDSNGAKKTQIDKAEPQK